MRKGLKIAMGLGLTAGLVAVAASPLLALRSLAHGIAARQPQVVAQRVDFPALRANLKAGSHDKIERENAGTLLEPLGNFFGKALADEAIETRLTPEGLIELVCEQNGAGNSAEDRSKPCKLDGKLVAMRYLSTSRFRVDLLRADGVNSALILARGDGSLNWRVVDALEIGKHS